MKWYRYPFWVFDMDGTLTHSIHDFQAIKRELGLPLEQGILESLKHLSDNEAKPIHQRLEAIEWELAGQAVAADGAAELLTALNRAGAKVGVLTRNTKVNARKTLETAGLADFFPEPHILGRDQIKPKPDPEGLCHLLSLWEAEPAQTVMVGDFKFDLEAARSAGVFAVYIDPGGHFPFLELADFSVRSLSELLPFKVNL